MNEELISLLMSGRNLLYLGNAKIGDAMREFVGWDKAVAEWVRQNLDASLLATYSSLMMPMRPGEPYQLHNVHPELIQTIAAAVQKRMDWLSKYACVNSATLQTAKGTHQEVLGREVFVVHGHDQAMREKVARLIDKLGFKPIILHEQASKGRTIIEKFTDHAAVGFAVVLLTADDKGGVKGTKLDDQHFRARQNVILELGFFLGTLGRGRVCPLVEKGVETPSDYDGVVYVPIDDAGAWMLQLAKEMKAAGLPVNMNSLA